MKANKSIDQALLKKHLNYDPLTGIFTWTDHESNQSQYRGKVAGGTCSNGYLKITLLQKFYLQHRLAWLYVHGDMPENHIDHIDGDRTNNAISNLRDVPRTTNSQNQHVPHTQKKRAAPLGVTFHKPSSRWMSQIQFKRKNKYLGIFDTPEAAHQAYLIAKRELHEGCTI